MGQPHTVTCSVCSGRKLRIRTQFSTPILFFQRIPESDITAWKDTIGYFAVRASTKTGKTRPSPVVEDVRFDSPVILCTVGALRYVAAFVLDLAVDCSGFLCFSSSKCQAKKEKLVRIRLVSLRAAAFDLDLCVDSSCVPLYFSTSAAYFIQPNFVNQCLAVFIRTVVSLWSRRVSFGAVFCCVSSAHCGRLAAFDLDLCVDAACSPVFQHIPVREVSDGVGAGADGGLHPRVPLRVPVALLAPPPQRLRLIQVPGTGE